MNTKFSYLKVLAGATCVLAMAACDSVKDVENKPAATQQPETVILGGEIIGLSSLRAITLVNNGDEINAKSFINAAPTAPNTGVRPVPFSFGTLPVGASYNVTIKAQPELKNCVVQNGQGVLVKGAAPNIVINCADAPGTSRYNLTVNLPTDASLFTNLQGAKVRVTTEEEIREVAVTSGQTTVVFTGVLINATGSLNPAPWTVQASTFEGEKINKCVVTNPTGTNPTGNITTPIVGKAVNTTEPACKFSVGGLVGYSQPPGTAYTPKLISGLKLQLRGTQANVLDEITVADCTPASADVVTSNVSTTNSQQVPRPLNGCAYTFNESIRSSSSSGLYEVAVSQQPTDLFCIVVNGGSVSVFTSGTVSPVPITNANVFCRAKPLANRQLVGVFRLQSSTWIPNFPATPPATNTSTWLPFDFTVWNTASSNMMAFFNNGTFLYGAHGNGAQVEHGFYDYDPAAQKLRFTSIVDTNTSTTFPANFTSTPVIAPGTVFTTIANTSTTTPGLSATPNPIRQNGFAYPAAHSAMTGVTLGTTDSGLGDVRTISGTFGADTGTTAAALVTAATPCATTAPFNCFDTATLQSKNSGNCNSPGTACTQPANANRLTWTLQEVPQVDGEMTGGWLAQDSRRLWVWDYRTYYGTGVGVLGGSPSMNDACFTMEDLHASSGIYTRRGSGTGCFPFSRPRTGQTPGYFLGTAESVDLTLFGPSAQAVIPALPDYTGRIPGGQPAPGTSSPSPVYFHVAPPGSFFSSANAVYFPTVSLDWCTTEVLGLRATNNGFPINPPVYLCRTRAN